MYVVSWKKKMVAPSGNCSRYKADSSKMIEQYTERGAGLTALILGQDHLPVKAAEQAVL